MNSRGTENISPREHHATPDEGWTALFARFARVVKKLAAVFASVFSIARVHKAGDTVDFFASTLVTCQQPTDAARRVVQSIRLAGGSPDRLSLVQFDGQSPDEHQSKERHHDVDQRNRCLRHHQGEKNRDKDGEARKQFYSHDQASTASLILRDPSPCIGETTPLTSIFSSKRAAWL